jgi:Domain of unknown function (DUF4160)
VNRLLIFLNELSCPLDDPITPERMLACVLRTLATLRAVLRIRRDLLLASHLPVTNIPLGDGTQSLGTILRGDIYRDEWRFISNLDQSSPWGAYPSARKPGDFEGVSHRGRSADGMTWARKSDSAVLSFGHPPDWNRDFIPARYETIDAAANIHTIEVIIRNLSAPEHVESHRGMIRDYGGDVSPSSLIYEANGYFIRMYFYDHDPPHFHVLLHRDTSQAQAKCAIGTLDILSGHLPPALRADVLRWARAHRVDLMINWERCQIGTHPFVLGH